jgi:hypothetical protein
MNSYKLNGQAGHHFRTAICKFLGIHHTEIYKTVKDIDRNGVIELKDGRKFKIVLEELKN